MKKAFKLLGKGSLMSKPILFQGRKERESLSFFKEISAVEKIWHKKYIDLFQKNEKLEI